VTTRSTRGPRSDAELASIRADRESGMTAHQLWQVFFVSYSV